MLRRQGLQLVPVALEKMEEMPERHSGLANVSPVRMNQVIETTKIEHS